MRLAFFAMMSAAAMLAGCDGDRRQAIVSDRDNATFRSAMADYQAGRLDAAAAGFEKVIAHSPMNATARFQLASLQHDHQHKYLEAIANYRIYAEIAPKSDKSAIAIERAKLCEEQFKTKMERDIRNSENAGMVADLKRQQERIVELEREKARLEAEVATRDRNIAALQLETERVRRLVGSIGADEETARPVDVADVKKLLDEEEDDEDRIKFSKDVALLLSEEPEESMTPPIQVAEKEKKEKEPEPEPLAPLPETYTVQEGDTLYKIAKDFYGTVGAWKQIREANKDKISTDGRIRAGQVIKLPPR